MTYPVVLYIVLGLFAGWWIWSNEVRRRKEAEAKLVELGRRLEKASLLLTPHAQLKKIFGILTDIHKKVTAVTKSLEKPAR